MLALPACVLIGLAFGAVGMAVTSYLRSLQDLEVVMVATVPLFLFSAPVLPGHVVVSPLWDGVLRWVVEATPLYRGVLLVRELTTRTAHRRVFVVGPLSGRSGRGGHAAGPRAGSASCCSPEGAD